MPKDNFIWIHDFLLYVAYDLKIFQTDAIQVCRQKPLAFHGYFVSNDMRNDVDVFIIFCILLF